MHALSRAGESAQLLILVELVHVDVALLFEASDRGPAEVREQVRALQGPDLLAMFHHALEAVVLGHAHGLFALDAIIELTGPEGIRRLPIREFYIKAGKVDIRQGELQTGILIPKQSYQGYRGHYIKYAMRNAMDIATLGCSANVKLSEDKTVIEDVRIAYGVAGPIPMRAVHAEEAGRGKEVSARILEEIAEQVLFDIHPRDSWRASKAFREHIARVLCQRALKEAIVRTGGVIHE